MGMRGPQPTPTETLKLRGSWLVNQRQNEPTPTPGTPEPPEWFSEEERAVWDDVVPTLLRMRVLTVADGRALARYCRFWVRWRRCEEFIDKHGTSFPIMGKDKAVKGFQTYPQAVRAEKLADMLNRLEDRFGLTPAARTRISVELKPETENHKARYFGGGSA